MSTHNPTPGRQKVSDVAGGIVDAVTATRPADPERPGSVTHEQPQVLVPYHN